MTSHRKSTCDGIGGTVTRLINRINLQSASSGHITTPIEIYNYAKENKTNINFFYISDKEISINVADYNLEKRYQESNTFYGIRYMHQFLPTSLNRN